MLSYQYFLSPMNLHEILLRVLRYGQCHCHFAQKPASNRGRAEVAYELPLFNDDGAVVQVSARLAGHWGVPAHVVPNQPPNAPR